MYEGASNAKGYICVYIYIYMATSCQTCHEKVSFEECISGTKIVKEIMSESFLRLLLLWLVSEVT